MKYRIIELLPAQILVEFENETRALVTISPEATPEEIDHAVAQYDPDFLPNPENLINQNISVDEERESKKIDITTDTIINSDVNATEEFSSLQSSNITHLLNSLNPINLILGNYYAEQGDTRIKEALYSKILDYANSNNITAETVLESINFIPEENSL